MREAHRVRAPPPEEGGERPQPVAARSRARRGRRRPSRDSRRVRAARPRPRPRSAPAGGGRRCPHASADPSPGRRAAARRRPRAPARAGREPRPRERCGARRAGAAARRHSIGPRKSETTMTSARCVATRSVSSSASRSDAVAARRELAEEPQRLEQRSAVPASAARPTARAQMPTVPSRLPRRVAAYPTATATPSATSALRRSPVPNAIDADASSTSHVTSTRSASSTRTCGIAGARSHVPLDAPHVVAGLVRAHLPELAADTGERRAVVAGEQPVDAAPDRELERAQRRGRERPRARLLRRPDRCERVGGRARQADAAALRRPRSICGVGTAASTVSRIESGATSSASAR